MSHTVVCITTVLPDIDSCVWPDGDPRMAVRGEVCERCYDRIDHAITVADHLRTLNSTLHGAARQSGEIVDYKVNGEPVRSIAWILDGDGTARAVTPNPEESSSRFAGPQVPLTALQLEIEAIDRAQAGHTDPAEWVATEEGAAQAVRFARRVHTADLAHPTEEHEKKLRRLRCPNCRRQTATWRPPAWPGDDVHITCLACKWEATNPEALDIAAHIERKGKADDSDYLIPFLRAKDTADRAARKQRRQGAA